MSCTFSHITHFSLISWLPQSLVLGMIRFSSVEFNLSLGRLREMRCVWRCIFRAEEYPHTLYASAVKQMEPIGSVPLLLLGDRLWCKAP